MSLPPSFFDHLSDRLELAVYDTNQEIRMATAFQGLASKLAKLKHDTEFEASKLDAKVEGMAAKMPTVFQRANSHVDGLTQQLADVETFVNEIEKATNGGPSLNDPAPVATVPPPNGFPDLNSAGVKP